MLTSSSVCSLLVLVALGSGSLCGQSEPPSSDQQKIEDLEQKVDALAAKLRDEDAGSAGKRGTSVSFGTGGVAIRSNDGNLQLKIGLDLQVDGRF